jgi:hypothetical protein
MRGLVSSGGLRFGLRLSFVEEVGGGKEEVEVCVVGQVMLWAYQEVKTFE